MKGIFRFCHLSSANKDAKHIGF